MDGKRSARTTRAPARDLRERVVANSDLAGRRARLTTSHYAGVDSLAGESEAGFPRGGDCARCRCSLRKPNTRLGSPRTYGRRAPAKTVLVTGRFRLMAGWLHHRPPQARNPRPDHGSETPTARAAKSTRPSSRRSIHTAPLKVRKADPRAMSNGDNAIEGSD